MDNIIKSKNPMKEMKNLPALLQMKLSMGLIPMVVQNEEQFPEAVLTIEELAGFEDSKFPESIILTRTTWKGEFKKAKYILVEDE